jgi:hypothetical protein
VQTCEKHFSSVVQGLPSLHPGGIRHSGALGGLPAGYDRDQYTGKGDGMRRLRCAGLCAGAVLAIGAGQAQAATLSISAAPPTVPAGGASISVTETGHADRDGQLIVYYQSAARHCQANSSDERNGPQGLGAVGQGLNDRTNIAAGENFQETAQFAAQGSKSYRVCGYLAGYDDSVSPDATADLLVCSDDAHRAGNDCVLNSAPPTTSASRLRISAPSRASGRFRVTLTWNARSIDHNVFLYAQPRSIRCYRSGEDERNHGYRHIRMIYTRAFNEPGSFRKTLSVKESAGGKTRLCAYLVGYNDLGRPHKRVSKFVG